MVLVIHGGAGDFSERSFPREKQLLFNAILRSVLEEGVSLLEKGISATDIVVRAVQLMEDNPLFNAGKGSVFNHKGGQEMDAALMRGSDLRAGAAVGLQRIRNPIHLAQSILDKSPHILLTGMGAEEFAEAQGIEFCPEEYFYVEERYQQLLQLRELNKVGLEYDEHHKYGTVGAVCLDVHGNLAAATSTGGMTNKRYGRVGDSALIGSGTYANNNSLAVSCTGHGEYFMRLCVAHDLHARVLYQGKDILEAAQELVLFEVAKLGGRGGLIAVDKEGNIAMPFTTKAMFRGAYTRDKKIKVAIF